MAKIHEIETCILCGNKTTPLTSNNKEEWERFSAFVNKIPIIQEGKCIEALTPHIMHHREADIIYLLCTSCCTHILDQILRQAIAERREILFQEFDALKKEL